MVSWPTYDSRFARAIDYPYYAQVSGPAAPFFNQAVNSLYRPARSQGHHRDGVLEET